jgi:photosystem II stability/assembly factor-like uncharacterized protein
MTTTAASAELPHSGGNRALAAPMVVRSLFLGGASIGAHMLVVGERGHILVSRDAGLSWTQAEVPTRATLTGVHLHDLNRAWAVGHDATILRTVDGGLNWETVFSAAEEQRPLLDVWFESVDHGFAVGAYGYFLETRDGGDTWKPRKIIDSDHHLNHISGVPSKRLYIAGEAGTLLRSDDGGSNWEPLPSPYVGSLFGTLSLDEQRVYIYGLRGHLYSSNDAGTSWQPIRTGTQNLLTDGIRVDSHGMLFTGMGGTLLLGERDVKPFQRANRLGIAGALDAGEGALVLFGEFGVERITDTQLVPLW